jgi:hypothetical protein
MWLECLERLGNMGFDVGGIVVDGCIGNEEEAEMKGSVVDMMRLNIG